MKQKTITGFLVDTKNQQYRRTEVPDELDAYYALLHCETIEIHQVMIGTNGKIYDCICDEEGSFENDPRISAIDSLGSALFVGSLLIVGMADEEGDLTSLNDTDCDYIEGFVKNIATIMHPEGSVMLTEVRMYYGRF